MKGWMGEGGTVGGLFGQMCVFLERGGCVWWWFEGGGGKRGEKEKRKQ